MDSFLHVFGQVQDQGPSLEGLNLTGIFVNGDGKGFATFRSVQGDVSSLVGGDVVPGVKLDQIGIDRVFLIVSGVRREMLLNQPRSEVAVNSVLPSVPVLPNGMPSPRPVVSPAGQAGGAPRSANPVVPAPDQSGAAMSPLPETRTDVAKPEEKRE